MSDTAEPQRPPRRDGAGGDERVRLLPLGGLGEFGMNCMVVEHGGEFVVIDCGVVFPDDDLLGIEALLPDWGWVLERADQCVGIVLTHGHEDHIGSMPYLLAELDVPVYGTPLTLALLERKLEERGLLDEADLRPVVPGRRVALGGMAFEMVRVTHSIPDAVAIALYTKIGVILHTGDFRFDHSPVSGGQTDIKRLSELGDQGVRCLLSDSTNIEQKGVSMSEAVVHEAIGKIIANAKGRVWITLFASNLQRLQGVIYSAHAAGRKLMVVGRSLRANLSTALSLGYLHLPDGEMLVEPDAFPDLPASRVVVACTGSQGEHRSALYSIVQKSHRNVAIGAGDTVIFSARVIPGNDRTVGRLQDAIWRMGAEVVTSRDAAVHTTGHAYEEEQKLMINLVRPALFVPVHGDFRMLVKHARLASRLGVPATQVIENGDVLELTREDAMVVDEVPVGKLYVDGRTIGRADDAVLRDRRRLARAGALVVMIGIDMDTGSVVARPELIQVGAVEPEAEAEVMELASAYILTQVEHLTPKHRLDTRALSEELQAAAKRFWRKRFNRKPWVIPIINDY